MKTEITLGRIKLGNKPTAIKLEFGLDNGNFTASAYVTECGRMVMGGQCLDEITQLVDKIQDEKNKNLFYKVLQWWKLYHLNDMHAGTPEQEKALTSAGLTQFANQYDKCCEYLKKIGLYEVRGYEFGHGWLKWEIPADIQAEMLETIKQCNKEA